MTQLLGPPGDVGDKLHYRTEKSLDEGFTSISRDGASNLAIPEAGRECYTEYGLLGAIK